jgi:hypothetical protein
VKVTADTITDEQIRELQDDRGAWPLDRYYQTKYACEVALQRIGPTSAHRWRHSIAREICAEIWNARHGGES